MELSVRSERVKRIDITGENGEVLGQIVFNPYDIGVYKKYIEILRQLAKDKQEHDAIVKEYESLPQDLSDEELFDTGEYEKLNERYQAGGKIGDGVVTIFDNLRVGIDGIFGDGVFDLFTQGYQDEGMLFPLFDYVKPFFEEAGKERNEKVESAKLNRAQRRSK